MSNSKGDGPDIKQPCLLLSKPHEKNIFSIFPGESWTHKLAKVGSRPKRRARVCKRVAKVQRNLFRKRRRYGMNAAATFIKKSPQAMRSLYLGSLQSRWLCGERRSDVVNERRRLLWKRKRHRERYVVRDDVSTGGKKYACEKYWSELEPAKGWQRQRTVARALATEQASLSMTFCAKEEQRRKVRSDFCKKSEQAIQSLLRRV